MQRCCKSRRVIRQTVKDYADSRGLVELVNHLVPGEMKLESAKG